MHNPFETNRLRLAGAAAITCGALATLGTAGARAQDLATCRFQTHIALSGSTFYSDGPGSANCTGLMSDAVAGSGGVFATQGSYGATDRCVIGSARGTFEATVPAAIYLIDPQSVDLSGTVQLVQAAGQALVVSGSGMLGAQPITYAGTGSFTPDSAQSCGVGGGTLTEQVVIADGGSSSAAQPAARTSEHHRSHHRYHNRRHRRRSTRRSR